MFSAALRTRRPLKKEEININLIDQPLEKSIQLNKRTQVSLWNCFQHDAITNLFEITPLGFGIFCLRHPISSGFHLSPVHPPQNHLKHPPFLLRQISSVTQQEVLCIRDHVTSNNFRFHMYSDCNAEKQLTDR